MIDFTSHIAADSARFIEAITFGRPDVTLPETAVPSCPDWSAADLTWHLAEVQHFWTHILDERVAGPEEYTRPSRPEDGELLGFLSACSSDLVAALERRADTEPCWSWWSAGGTVGWVRRRQAHEALIHRVDAEQVGGNSSPLDNTLAGDGVDEMLRVMLDVGELPPWAAFDAEDKRVVLDTGNRWWALTLGRFVGADPASDGPAVDLPALRVVDAGTGSGERAISDGDTRIFGSAPTLDVWLWGRGDGRGLEVFGETDALTRLRETAADATQ